MASSSDSLSRYKFLFDWLIDSSLPDAVPTGIHHRLKIVAESNGCRLFRETLVDKSKNDLSYTQKRTSRLKLFPSKRAAGCCRHFGVHPTNRLSRLEQDLVPWLRGEQMLLRGFIASMVVAFPRITSLPPGEAFYPSPDIFKLVFKFLRVDILFHFITCKI